MTKKKKIIIYASLSVIVLAAILFSLAYRYLIERVETPVSANTTAIITGSKNNNSEATKYIP
ncbi:hypothetical protein [Clostridium beijerinckii]|uniref:hypothetical protein n=1 Tax=Clostridium beijerinckii TaxID=1520 RepID=UPI00098C0E63|nr:hypothetical protein [Clostridium beijerinckii]NRT77808.1 hypothetical protein [Clostridium beijerinckii]OOM44424.1 hypothetical protein CBEIJ_36200 [Clostridium beijerinckii]